MEEKLYSMSEVSSLLSASGLKMGRNKLFKLLRVKGYVNGKNIAYPHFVQMGYFKVITANRESGFKCPMTLVSHKGVEFIREMLQNH